MKHPPINKISKKRARQLVKEGKLKIKLIARSEGICEHCGKWSGSWGLAKHELIYRSKGGDPTDEENCEMWCIECHDKEHNGINEV